MLILHYNINTLLHNNHRSTPIHVINMLLHDHMNTPIILLFYIYLTQNKHEIG